MYTHTCLGLYIFIYFPSITIRSTYLLKTLNILVLQETITRTRLIRPTFSSPSAMQTSGRLKPLGTVYVLGVPYWLSNRNQLFTIVPLQVFVALNIFTIFQMLFKVSLQTRNLRLVHCNVFYAKYSQRLDLSLLANKVQTNCETYYH